MAQAARKVTETPEMTDEARDVVALVHATPAIVLTDEVVRDKFFDQVKAECDAFVPDVSTEKGRDAVRAMASKVTKTKTAIKAAGLALTEEWRDLTKKVTSERTAMEDRLDALAKEVRKPLTEWEDAEKARKERADQIIGEIQTASIVREGETSEAVSGRAQTMRDLDIDKATFGMRLEMATDLRNAAVEALEQATVRLKKAEDDAAELAALREREAQRQRDEDARIAREKAEQEQKDRSEREEAARKQREADDAARIERERQEAADKAQREAEAKARAEQEERDRAAQAEIDAARERERAAQRESYARSIIQHISECAMGFIGGKQYPYVILLRELDEKIVIDDTFGPLEQEARDALAKARKIIVDAMERQAQQDQDEAEKRRREADRAHRSKIQREAKEAIMSCGVSEEVAKVIVIAIAANNVPHISIQF